MLLLRLLLDLLYLILIWIKFSHIRPWHRCGRLFQFTISGLSLACSVSLVSVLHKIVCILDLKWLVRHAHTGRLVHYNSVWCNDRLVLWALSQDGVRLIRLPLMSVDLFARNCLTRAFRGARHYFKSGSACRNFRLELVKSCPSWSHTLNPLSDQKVWGNGLEILFPDLSLFEVLIVSVDRLDLWLNIDKLGH